MLTICRVPSAADFLAAADATTPLNAEFTVFTPDDDAWAELNADIAALNEDTVFKIIGGHVLAGIITVQELRTMIGDSPGGMLELATVVEVVG